MSGDLAKRAARILLEGGTLLAQKCPYCSGVRVLKDGRALCTGCGREPEEKKIPDAAGAGIGEALQRKLDSLTAELEREADHGRQQEILRSINLLLDARAKAGQ